MDDDQRYMDWEMQKVQPIDGVFRLKFVGSLSESRWLNITQEQFDHIRKYLTGVGE